MAENAGAAQVALTPQEVAALDQALDAMSMSPVFGGTDLSAHARRMSNEGPARQRQPP